MSSGGHTGQSCAVGALEMQRPLDAIRRGCSGSARVGLVLVDYNSCRGSEGQRDAEHGSMDMEQIGPRMARAHHYARHFGQL
jgi:hypothetical protein